MRRHGHVSLMVLIAAASLAATVVACTSDPVVAPTVTCDGSTTSATVLTTAGAARTFSWAPACGAFIFAVENFDGVTQWVISANAGADTTVADNTMAPPITYGVVPLGASEPAAALTLKKDTTYIAYLWRVMPSATAANACVQSFETLCLLGTRQFTP